MLDFLVKEEKIGSEMEFMCKNVRYRLSPDCKTIEDMAIFDVKDGVVEVPREFSVGRTITNFGLGDTIVSCCTSKSKLKIKLPDTIESISESAFEWDRFTEQVEIPNSVTSIGEKAFRHSNIKEIIWPDNCPVVPERCFEQAKIERFVSGKSLQIINDYAFNLSQIKVIDLSKSLIGSIPFEMLGDSYVIKLVPPYYAPVQNDYGDIIGEDGTIFCIGNLNYQMEHKYIKKEDLEKYGIQL